MRVQGLAANKTAHFSVILEVFEMAPTFFMVDIQKAAGDVAECLKFYKNFCGNLEDIVWKPPNESSRTRVTVTKSKNKTGPVRFVATIMIVGCHPRSGPDRAFTGRELHRRCASLPSGDGVVATAAAAKNLGLKKLDFALGK
ncbi:hypothetical protein LWI29_031866 [Acer saccharum]|uniref:Uncharacterized protein n=1 Tax=Acer saccharum TaxID=4024 RepID=A0AA39SKW4_ACESA|nr:hypothetical protein LWI29_031866 [Acer saccharum]